MTPASPAQLRDGTWGARARGTVQVGEVLEVTTRAGKSWRARVTRVVWSGQGVTICATESLDRPAGSTRRGRSCACNDDCCAHGCRCHSECNCRGGNIYDC